MARMPGATWRPLGPDPSVEGRMARYDIVCIHTMVGSLWGTDSYFHQDGYGGTESHFGTGYDGETLQWQDTLYRADANLDGGDRVLSIENADMGTGFPAWSGSNVPAFTAAQIEANAQIVAWAHLTHGIPLRLIPDTSLDERGIGYHRQGIDPWRCSTCERWSNADGKVCPGDRRVAQIPQIIARAQQIVSGEDDMTAEEIADAVWERIIAFDTRAGTMLSQTRTYSADAREASRAARDSSNAVLGVVNQIHSLLTTDVDQLAAAIAAHIPPNDVNLETVKQGVREVLLEGVAPAP